MSEIPETTISSCRVTCTGDAASSGDPLIYEPVVTTTSYSSSAAANAGTTRTAVATATQRETSHLTDSVNDPVKGAQSQALRIAMSSGDYSTLDTNVFNVLRDDIGLNTGNQNNSPLWVHMVAGLGTGLFLFDEDGCPTNPLDKT